MLSTDPRRRRWVLWGVLAVAFLLVNVYRLSTAVLAADLTRAFRTTATQLGTLHAAFFWIYAAMQIPAGILADRTGPRRTAGVGALVMGVGAIGFALSGTYAVGFLSRALIGLGASVIYIAILRFCANWYRASEFATMNGLTVSIAGVGGILATTPLAVVVVVAGWRPTFVSLGVLTLMIAGLILVLVRDSPTKAGLPRITGVPRQTLLTFSEARDQLGLVLRDRATWVVGVMLFCTTGLNLTLFGLWGVPYVVRTYGTSVTFASTLTLLGSAGLLVGPPAFGWASDRLGRRTGLIVAGSVAYTLCFSTLAIVAEPPMVVVAGVYLFSGILLGVYVLSYAVVKERHASSAGGISMGTVNGAAFLGAAVLPTLMGFVLDAYWTGDVVAGARVYTGFGYQVAFGIGAVCGLVALLCALWLHRTTER